MTTERKLEIGSAIIYVDTRGVRHNALCISVWDGMRYGGPQGEPGCNLIYVLDDPNRKDEWGRQIERMGSQVHMSNQPAHGAYWCWPDESK